MGGLTGRGPNGAFCLPGTRDLPEPATLLSPQALPGSPPALASAAPDAVLSLKRFSLAEPTLLLPEPGL